MNYTALSTELTTDPAKLGYAALVKAGQDQAIADLLNTVTDTDVSIPSVSKNHFLKAILPATLALPAKSDEVQKKWDRIINLVNAVDGDVDVSDGNTLYLLKLAVTDGILSQEQVDAIGIRKGSRAEVVLGVGTVITQQDVSYALRGTK